MLTMDKENTEKHAKGGKSHNRENSCVNMHGYNSVDCFPGTYRHVGRALQWFKHPVYTVAVSNTGCSKGLHAVLGFGKDKSANLQIYKAASLKILLDLVCLIQSNEF